MRCWSGSVSTAGREGQAWWWRWGGECWEDELCCWCSERERLSPRRRLSSILGGALRPVRGGASRGGREDDEDERSAPRASGARVKSAEAEDEGGVNAAVDAVAAKEEEGCRSRTGRGAGAGHTSREIHAAGGRGKKRKQRRGAAGKAKGREVHVDDRCGCVRVVRCRCRCRIRAAVQRLPPASSASCVVDNAMAS